MTTYQVDMNQVETICGEMEAITADISALINALDEGAKANLASWNGAAQAAYTQCQAQWDAAAANMRAASVTATNALGEINSYYRQGEVQGQNLWESA